VPNYIFFINLLAAFAPSGRTRGSETLPDEGIDLALLQSSSRRQFRGAVIRCAGLYAPLLLSVSPRLAAATYFVSPNGSDTNSCQTVVAPCLTIAHAESLSSAGDTISLAPGLYRLVTSPGGNTSTTGRITPKNNQTFTGPICTPSVAACTAIVSGSILIGPLATGPDTHGYWEVSGQSQQGNTSSYPCDTGWEGCNFPEDVFWDGNPLQHVGYTLGGTISYSSVSGGAVSGTGTCTVTTESSVMGNGGGYGATGTISVSGGAPAGSISLTYNPEAWAAVPTLWVLSGGAGGAICSGSPIMKTTGGTLVMPTLTTSQFLFDYVNRVIYLPENPSGHTVETSVLNTFFTPSAASNVTVENLTVEEFATQMTQGGGIDPSYGMTSSPSSATGWVVKNNYITLVHALGLRVGFGMQALNNVMTENGNLGIGGGLPPGNSITPSGLLVQGNIVTYNNYARVSPGFGAGGIKFGNTAYATVRENTIDNNLGNALHFDVNSIAPLIDGNTIGANSDPLNTGVAVVFEIGTGGATIRNNYIQFNGRNGSYGIQSSTSQGAQAYCNVVEEMANATNMLWTINTTDRGTIWEAPNVGTYMTSAGNYFHHNTFIWDAGATGSVGFEQHDTINQPEFFTANTPPDENTYHITATLGMEAEKFIYDNSNSGANTPLTFSAYQANGADVHSTIDTNSTSGFPAVQITSPADQSTVPEPTTITASASDESGISKVEFYVDWNLATTLTASPYSYTAALASGSHVVAAMAYSNAGIRNCNAVTVSAMAPSGPPNPPTNLSATVQ